jgi:hypothetical protein
MQTLTLGLLLAAAGPQPLRLSSGWPTVLDLSFVQTVTALDPRVVQATRLDDRQVLLVGNAPGHTRLSVEVGPWGATHRVEYEVTVARAGTATERQQRVVELEVDHEQLLELPQLRRVVSGDPAICESSLGPGDTLRLLSRRPGETVLLLWVGGTEARHRRALVITAKGGVNRTADDLDESLTEPLDGRLALIAGEHARVPVPGTRRFESRDPSVVVATLHPSGELLVEARGVGATWVQTWADDGTPGRFFVVVNHHTVWDPHSLDWLLRLEEERRAAEDPGPPAPVELRSIEAPGHPD